MPRKIELLAPARDLATAREAVLHGADAVYIGAPRFGARAAAGNSVEDIRELAAFAHLYGVRVYVTLNTILFDDELDEAQRLAAELQEAGVDALIVQDLAFLNAECRMQNAECRVQNAESADEDSTLQNNSAFCILHSAFPPIALHASTQMDNRTAEKVQWLWEQGFSQAVLARELTLEEIAEIHCRVPQMPLEVFVHGATCVSYNGQCYASQYCFGRSANRGECAQFCRLPFDLIENEGGGERQQGWQGGERQSYPKEKVLQHQRHLLSLHDMNRSHDLEALLDAGVTSLKIEGRLKDAGYVKNVTAYYRQRLDEIMRRRPQDYERSSVGKSCFAFTPQLNRSFNRGFSDYFLHGRTADMVQMATPKSMGERVGQVKEVRRNCFTVSGLASFCNGDGLCFLDEQGRLQGFRVNRAEGNCLYPKEMPQGLRPRMTLFRNFDQAFEQLLSRPTATRKIGVSWSLERNKDSQQNGGNEQGEFLKEKQNTVFLLTMTCEDGVQVSQTFATELQPARSPQQEAVRKQLERLGDTCYESQEIQVNIPFDYLFPSSPDVPSPSSPDAPSPSSPDAPSPSSPDAPITPSLDAPLPPSSDCFIPASVLAAWRREMVERMNAERLAAHVIPPRRAAQDETMTMLQAFEGKQSVPGHLTYLANAANRVARAFLLKQGATEVDEAMEVSQGGNVLMTTRYCIRYELGLCPKHHGARPTDLSLRSADGKTFPLKFDCRRCQMQVLPPSSKLKSGDWVEGKWVNNVLPDKYTTNNKINPITSNPKPQTL